MLGLAVAARGQFETVFTSFSEGHLCRDFLSRVSAEGFDATELSSDTPHLLRAKNEVRQILRKEEVSVLLCHGYKAGLIGWWAARRAGIPVVAVSRGWTGESRKVRVYEWLDKKVLRYMDRVVCVSQAQADKIRRCGVSEQKIVVIPNAIDVGRFENLDPAGRTRLEKMFPTRPQQIIGAAGRLSPEKGFDVLIDAARAVIAKNPKVGFVLFGEGQLRKSLAEQVSRHGLQDHFVFAGFCSDLDALLPHFDLFVQSSHTEGMPNVILEALAAGVPVVATNVGGTGEIIKNGLTGRLVDANSADQLIAPINEVLQDQTITALFSANGKSQIQSQFGFANQAQSYRRLFAQLVPSHRNQNEGIMHSMNSACSNSMDVKKVEAETSTLPNLTRTFPKISGCKQESETNGKQ